MKEEDCPRCGANMACFEPDCPMAGPIKRVPLANILAAKAAADPHAIPVDSPEAWNPMTEDGVLRMTEEERKLRWLAGGRHPDLDVLSPSTIRASVWAVAEIDHLRARVRDLELEIEETHYGEGRT